MSFQPISSSRPFVPAAMGHRENCHRAATANAGDQVLAVAADKNTNWRNDRLRVGVFVLWILVAATAIVQTGCLGLASNLMHAAGMDMIPAEYEGLEDSSVAIVVLTPSARHADDPAGLELTRRVQRELNTGIKKIRMVRADRVADWRDTQGYDNEDYVQLGRDVEADKVVVISLDDLKLREGATLYRGSSDATIEVFDVATGTVAHTKMIDDYTYPTMAGQSTSETTEKRFRALYLSMLAAEIGRCYRPYDAHEKFALDSKIAGY